MLLDMSKRTLFFACSQRVQEPPRRARSCMFFFSDSVRGSLVVRNLFSSSNETILTEDCGILARFDTRCSQSRSMRFWWTSPGVCLLRLINRVLFWCNGCCEGVECANCQAVGEVVESDDVESMGCSGKRLEDVGRIRSSVSGASAMRKLELLMHIS